MDTLRVTFHRSDWRGLTSTAALVATVLLAGCQAAPVAPSSPTAAQPSSAPASPRLRQPVVTIEGQKATISGPDRDGYFDYNVRFVLREITGLGDATVQNVWPVSPDGPAEGYNFGPDCFHATLLVPSEGTLDVFSTDASVSALACVPATWGRTRAGQIDLQVTYLTADGAAVARATVPVVNAQ